MEPLTKNYMLYFMYRLKLQMKRSAKRIDNGLKFTITINTKLHSWLDPANAVFRQSSSVSSRNYGFCRFAGINRRAGISIELILGSDHSVAVGWRKKEQKMAATGAIRALLC
ncbi:hypothetical protein R6Q59_025503 [Mikania micrantha]